MSDYNLYVTAINKIFDYLSKMKTGWNSIDNLNYIESIEEYKQIVAQSAERIKGTSSISPMKLDDNKLEALGND